MILVGFIFQHEQNVLLRQRMPKFTINPLYCYFMYRIIMSMYLYLSKPIGSNDIPKQSYNRN